MKLNRGFTLIELIVVIVILGILAATALPRFVDVQDQARRASVDGISGALRSAASLARAAWLVAGSSSATTVNMDGQTVDVNASGYPLNTATGIGRALQSTDGYAVVYGTPTTFTPPGGSATCRAEYNVGTVTAQTSGPECN